MTDETSPTVIATRAVMAGTYDDEQLIATVWGTEQDAQRAADEWNLANIATIAHTPGASYAWVGQVVSTELPREIHAAGMGAETVTYRLPYGGLAVYRVLDTTGAAERFEIVQVRREDGGRWIGSRDECLAETERLARRVADAEGRRRAGSHDPADHQVGGDRSSQPEVLAHALAAYWSWRHSVPAFRGLPDQGRRHAGISNSVSSNYAALLRVWQDEIDTERAQSASNRAWTEGRSRTAERGQG